MNQDTQPTTEELQEYFYLSTDGANVIYVLFLKQPHSDEEASRISYPLSIMVFEQMKQKMAEKPGEQFGYMINLLPLRRDTIASVNPKAQEVYRAIVALPQISVAAYVVSNSEYNNIPAYEEIGVSAAKPVRAFCDFPEAVDWLHEEFTK